MRVRYQTFEFNNADDIHVRTLRDTQQTSESSDDELVPPSMWGLFGIIWDAGLVMAHHVDKLKPEGLRILELGCGIGLASLVLSQQHADITATDYNPAAGRFLQQNTTLNGSDEIPFIHADWSDLQSSDQLGSFDLILGSDVLYERGAAAQLCEFIERHAAPACTVIIVDAHRGNQGRFSKAMAEKGYTCDRRLIGEEAFLAERFRGNMLTYTRQATG
ncbi:MAG: putative nicotinamide N-methyase [Myxococcota bacterium]|jgi:predicted nicotinamide N-methyase